MKDRERAERLRGLVEENPARAECLPYVPRIALGLFLEHAGDMEAAAAMSGVTLRAFRGYLERAETHMKEWTT